tara:strand:- start:94 stop:804 length:711 start_codon:yes stop_codon:yes gene_type:complete
MKKLAIIGCSHSNGVMLTAPPEQKPVRRLNYMHQEMLEWGYWKGWPHDIYEKYNYETYVYSYPGGGIQDAFFTLSYFLSNNIHYDKIILQLSSEPRWNYYPMEATFQFKKFPKPSKEMFFRMRPCWEPMTRKEAEIEGGYYEMYTRNLLNVINYLPFDILAFSWHNFGTKTNLEYIIPKEGFSDWLEKKLGKKQYTLHKVDYIIDGQKFYGSHLDEEAQKYITEDYYKNELDKFLK